MSILLVTPPFTQLNTPYPATAYLMGFLRTKNIPAAQMDLGIEVINALFTPAKIAEVFAQARREIGATDQGAAAGCEAEAVRSNVRRILALEEEYLATITPVVSFLQHRQPTLARQIASENFLPQAQRFADLPELDDAFGNMGLQDKAKYLATLYLEDLADFIVATVDPHFGFSRYAERLGRSANRFDELQAALEAPLSFIDRLTLAVFARQLTALAEVPTLVAFSVPFPGNLFAAFRCAQWLKAHYPGVRTAMGGGFPNTELRSVRDPRVFDYFDFITLDDGELPLELLYRQLTAATVHPALAGSGATSLAPGSVLSAAARATAAPRPDLAPALRRPAEKKPLLLKRTFYREEGVVCYNDFALQRDYRMSEVGTPDYSGLLLDRYLSVIEVINPMHSLWSDGRWNKLTMAHGCYWGKCTFCDVTLDYIGNYQPLNARLLVDRMEEMIAATGESGFHFVDEAAPPALMRDVALEIIRRKLRVSWWTNIRFEKSFTSDLCRLLQASGCIAVSGGLEVASDRLLDLIKKGVSVAQVARVTQAFTDAGIMVHAYLMYGYPTQTVQETVDSLEMVRQLFQAGIIQSGFWHQFALTTHSPIGQDPAAYGITPHPATIEFADNDVQFTDHTGVDHGKFSYGLKKSLFNYMHGQCFTFPLQEWFDFRIPPTTIAPDFIAASLACSEEVLTRANARVIWVGGQPALRPGASSSEAVVVLYDRRDTDYFSLPQPLAEWLLRTLQAAGDRSVPPVTVADLRADFARHFSSPLEDFWCSEAMELVRAYGLLVV